MSAGKGQGARRKKKRVRHIDMGGCLVNTKHSR